MTPATPFRQAFQCSWAIVPTRCYCRRVRVEGQCCAHTGQRKGWREKHSLLLEVRERHQQGALQWLPGVEGVLWMQPEGWGGHRTEGGLVFIMWTGVAEGYQQAMAQSPASCTGRGARQEEGTVQAGDISARNSVRLQPAGTEGVGRCAPGPWAVAVTSPKPGNPERARLGTGGHAHMWDSLGQ